MRKLMLNTLAAVLAFCLAVPVAPAASSSSQAPIRNHIVDGQFRGTQTELVAAVLPTLLQRAGTQVTVADQALAASLQKTFGGRTDYLWWDTFVRSSSNGIGFSVTLPGDEARMRQGRLVLGVLENGRLARAFELKVDQSWGKLNLTLIRPDGKLAGRVDVRVGKDGKLNAERSELVELGTLIMPNARGELFDMAMNALNDILGLLYMVRDLLNMAICAVEEAMNFIVELEYCGWSTQSPGGGRVVQMVICSIEEVIELIETLKGRCF